MIHGLIQRQVRQYLAQHEASIPGNKGPTTVPTATVIFESFATVTRVELTLEDMTVCQIQGWQAHHELICKALELDLAIYENLSNSRAALKQFNFNGLHFWFS